MPRAPARGPRNAGYPSCRRPLLFRHGNRRLDPDALFAFKEPPARVTQSLTSSEVEDWDACLLLLAALGLPCALFCRGLRLRLSLLRHAALLAMSEWRYQCPQDANTAFGLLQRAKKTSIFAASRIAARNATLDVACLGAQKRGDGVSQEKSERSMAHLSVMRRNAREMAISIDCAFRISEILSERDSRPSLCASGIFRAGQARAMSCEKNLVTTQRPRVRALKFSANRANRTQVIRLKSVATLHPSS